MTLRRQDVCFNGMKNYREGVLVELVEVGIDEIQKKL